MAAPVSEVTSPTRRGNAGIGRFRSDANNPSACNRAFNRSKAACNAPTPSNSTAVTRS